MLHQRWPFVTDLLNRLRKPNGQLEDRPANQVYRLISNSSNENLDSQGKIAALSAASLVNEVVFNGENVVPPSLIRGKIKHQIISVNVGAEHELEAEPLQKLYELETQVLKILSTTGLKRVNGKYISRGKYEDCEYILVVPIISDVDDILTEYGNPVTVSEQFIRNVVKRGLSDKRNRRDRDYADRRPEVSQTDLEVYVALIISDLENGDHDWLQLQTLGSDFRLWVDTEAVGDTLRTYAPKMTEVEFRFLLLKSLFQDLASIPGSVPILVDGYFTAISDHLREHYGCEKLVLDGTQYRYTSKNHYEAELRLYGQPHVDIARNLNDANQEEVEESYRFHKSNQNVMNTFYDQNEYAQRLTEMESWLEADKELNVIDEARQGAEDIESEASYKPARGPTEYGVLREFERTLEEKREDDEDDDTGSYGYQVI